MGSYSIPLSGLTAAQAQLQAVSNNLSNINTDGYKDMNVLFADVFAQANAVNGAGNPLQAGLGVSTAATVSNFTNGNVSSTGISSNMALSGQGFFVVRNADGSNGYTRAGDFTTNKAGYLTTPDGELLLGYPATGGVVNTGGALQTIQVGTGVVTPAVATTNISVTANLSSNSVIGSATSKIGAVGNLNSTPANGATASDNVTIYDSLGQAHTLSTTYTWSAANSRWDYTVTIPTADVTPGGAGTTTVESGALTPNGAGGFTDSGAGIVIPSFSNSATGPQNITFSKASITSSAAASSTSSTAQDGSAASTVPSSSLAIFDSLGAQHQLTVSYTKTASNTWNYTVSIPTSDITAGGTGSTTVGSGTLHFDGAGKLTSIGNQVAIKIPTYANGATQPQDITGPFGTAGNYTITQTASNSTTSATNQDGYASGSLQSYSIGADGTVQGTFSSGKTLALGQVAVATFANNQGLSDAGHNNYEETAASGNAVIGQAGTGGRGTITGGSVEQSNVDISTEFSKLIVAQQAYSANAKAVTTFNQISQAMLQMIQ